MAKKIAYALLKADPSSKPPFDVELGFEHSEKDILKDCKHIPDAIEKIVAYCEKKSVEFSENFTLLYPIYLEAMNTEYEGLMHQIAWLILDESQKNEWKFDRIGGYTGKTTDSFLPE